MIEQNSGGKAKDSKFLYIEADTAPVCIKELGTGRSYQMDMLTPHPFFNSLHTTKYEESKTI